MSQHNTDILLAGAPRRVFAPLQPSLVHSSLMPTPEQEKDVQKVIYEVTSELSSVDHEISRLRSALAELELQRTDLHTSLQHQRAVLSPIRRIPPEVLGEIFIFAAAGSSIAWPRQNDNADEVGMPWLLGKICSYWRTIALSLPKLWTQIHLELKFYVVEIDVEDQKAKFRAVQNFLDVCLARSGRELLTLSIDAKGPPNRIRPILSSLTAHSERWEDVSLDLDMFPEYDGDLAVVRNRVQHLRRLHIGAPSMEDAPITPILAFENAPKLREVSITSIAQPFHVLRLPWSQVTHLTSKGSTFREGEFTQIMQHTTNLISFSTEGERILEVGSSQPISLPYLTDLTITNKGSYISKTFQFLTAPNLQRLSIRAITPFVADQAVSMIVRSQCKPTNFSFRASLDFEALWDENLGLVWMLSELPSVSHLHLIVLRSADNIMPRLVNHHRAGLSALLPNLQTFILEDRFCLSAGEVTEVLSSRIKNFSAGLRGSSSSGSNQPVGLRSIHLQLSRPAAPKFPELDLLKKVAENHGVEITIQSG